jgi:hypothetical protein
MMAAASFNFQQVGPGRKLKTEASRDLFPRGGARHEAWQQSLSHRCEFGRRQSAHYRETHVLHAILFHFRSLCRLDALPLTPEGTTASSVRSPRHAARLSFVEDAL